MARQPPDHAWEGNTDELLDRLRPVKLRYDIAIAVAAIAIGAAIIWSAYLLREPRLRFTMISNGDSVYVLDQRTGEVAACRLDGTTTICTEDDSAIGALMRRLQEQNETID